MQEFGTVQEYRQAWDQLKHYKNVNAKELKAEAKKRQELEREELKLKDLEVIFFILFSRKNCSFFIIYILFFFSQELIAQTRAKSNLKAKTAESEGKLLCNQCQASMFPDAEGFYEFESNFYLSYYFRFVIRIRISSQSKFKMANFRLPVSCLFFLVCDSDFESSDFKIADFRSAFCLPPIRDSNQTNLKRLTFFTLDLVF